MLFPESKVLYGWRFFSFQVIQRYYVQYLSGYDAVALNQCIQNLHNLTDDESILLSSIWQSISHLTVEQVEDPEHTFDFRYPPYIFNLISMLSVYKKITNEHYVMHIELAFCASILATRIFTSGLSNSTQSKSISKKDPPTPMKVRDSWFFSNSKWLADLSICAVSFLASYRFFFQGPEAGLDAVAELSLDRRLQIRQTWWVQGHRWCRNPQHRCLPHQDGGSVGSSPGWNIRPVNILLLRKTFWRLLPNVLGVSSSKQVHMFGSVKWQIFL